MSTLAWIVVTGLTFLPTGLVTYGLGSRLDVSRLIPFAAGNFPYIGASDLVPEAAKHDDPGANLVHLLVFVSGPVLLLFARVLI